MVGVDPMRAEPERKIILVKQSYWACGIASHRHTTEEVAARCIDREERTHTPTGCLRWRNDDYLAVLTAYRSGSTQVAIAKQIGVSTSRIGQVIARARRMELRRIVSVGSDQYEVMQQVAEETAMAGHNIAMLSRMASSINDGYRVDVSKL